MHHPRISELQKNFGGTLKQGSPKNQDFTAGLVINREAASLTHIWLTAWIMDMETFVHIAF